MIYSFFSRLFRKCVILTAQGQLCPCTQPQFLCPNRSPSRFSISSRASCRRPHYFYRFSPYSRLRPRDLAQIARGDLSAATSSFFATFFRSGSGTVHRLLIKRRISLSTQYFYRFLPYSVLKLATMRHYSASVGGFFSSAVFL